MAAASGDELIKEKNQVDNDVRKYTMLKRSYDDNHYRLQSDIQTRIPHRIKRGEQILDNLQKDITCRDNSDYKRIFAPKKRMQDNILLIVVNLLNQVIVRKLVIYVDLKFSLRENLCLIMAQILLSKAQMNIRRN